MFEKIVSGYRLSYDEAVKIMNECELDELCTLADQLRNHFCGNKFDTCSIINARSGRCSENCKWCSQSKYHNTDIEVYPLLENDVIVEAAQYNAAKGVGRFSLVTSGRAMSGKEIDKVCDTYREIGGKIGIKLCASMGLLKKEDLQKLRDAGVERYHCNLETAPSYFPTLCSTHTTDEKLKTIRWAQEVGMKICSGGIIGMGETAEQRVELAVTLREAGVDSIPVNILNPIPGTPLENTKKLTDDEILRSFAMFRIVNPQAQIRFAGGRTLINTVQTRALKAGVSAAIVGDMLTTVGSKIDQDMQLFKSLGYEI